jgi:hypothetical protein
VATSVNCGSWPARRTAESTTSPPAARSPSTPPTPRIQNASRTDRPSSAGRPLRSPSTRCPSTTAHPTAAAPAHVGATVDDNPETTAAAAICTTPLARSRRRPGVWLFSYGKIPDQPVVFEVIAATLNAEIPPEHLDAFLEEERKASEKNPPADFKQKGPSARVTVGGRPGIYIEYEAEDVLARSYLVVLGDREIMLRGYSLKERPPAWNDVEQKVAATIARE